jgi:hypothetical protein
MYVIPRQALITPVDDKAANPQEKERIKERKREIENESTKQEANKTTRWPALGARLAVTGFRLVLL